MSSKAQPFNVLLEPDQRAALQALARARRTSQGQVIRALIGVAHSMTFLATPLCASGDRCFVPHLHQAAPSSPAPNPKEAPTP